SAITRGHSVPQYHEAPPTGSNHKPRRNSSRSREKVGVIVLSAAVARKSDSPCRVPFECIFRSQMQTGLYVSGEYAHPPYGLPHTHWRPTLDRAVDRVNKRAQGAS